MRYERRKKLLDYISKNAPTSVEGLAALLEVSIPTIRRDLIQLEDEGLVLRERGMVTIPSSALEPMYSQRVRENQELKKSIAYHVAEHVSEGEVIALDIGTTCVEIAKRLLTMSSVTVFTPSFQVASILSRSNNSVYLIGGLVRKAEMSLTGSIAVETVLKFNFDRFYLSLAGISRIEGATDYSIEEAEVKRAFIKKSREVIAVVDKEKFGKTALVKVCDLNDIGEIVSNADENRDVAKELGYTGKLTLV